MAALIFSFRILVCKDPNRVFLRSLVSSLLGYALLSLRTIMLLYRNDGSYLVLKYPHEDGKTITIYYGKLLLLWTMILYWSTYAATWKLHWRKDGCGTRALFQYCLINMLCFAQVKSALTHSWKMHTDH